MSRDNDPRVYVGNLPPDIRQKELETLFEKYGKIVNINLKNGDGRGPPFAFIEYDDYRYARWIKCCLYLFVFLEDNESCMIDLYIGIELLF